MITIFLQDAIFDRQLAGQGLTFPDRDQICRCIIIVILGPKLVNEMKFFLVHLIKVTTLDALWSCNKLPLTETLPFAFVEIKLRLKLNFLPLKRVLF